MLKIVTYNGENKDATFYVQSHGNNAGRPLKQPIPNCFAIYTNKENAFEIVYALWIGKAFYQFIGGTAIPFIKIKHVKNILSSFFAKDYNPKHLEAIQSVSNLIEIQKKTITQYEDLRRVLARQAMKAN